VVSTNPVFLLQYEFTPLHLASQSGHVNLVRMILNYPGVRVDAATAIQAGWRVSDFYKTIDSITPFAYLAANISILPLTCWRVVVVAKRLFYGYVCDRIVASSYHIRYIFINLLSNRNWCCCTRTSICAVIMYDGRGGNLDLWISKFDIFPMKFSATKVVLLISSGQNEILPLLALPTVKILLTTPGKYPLFPPRLEKNSSDADGWHSWYAFVFVQQTMSGVLQRQCATCI